MGTHLGMNRIRAALIAAACLAWVTASAQTPLGDVLAGQVSPWRNAGFVVAAYGAVWVGVVWYVFFLFRKVTRLRREVTSLQESRKNRPS